MGGGIDIKLTRGWICGAVIVALSLWILHSFLQALLAACVTAIASWPLYTRFADRLESRVGPNAIALMFTFAMTVFVLAPAVFALWAIFAQTDALVGAIAAADKTGIAVPYWLETFPLAGPWFASRWQTELARAGGLSVWAQRTEPAVLLAWAGSAGQFMTRHLFIVLFAILVLFFLYREGQSLGRGIRRVSRHLIGERAETYLDLAVCAARASVTSMLVVSLFDGFATAIVYAVADVSRAAEWAAITGAFALVPFLAYGAVAALALQLAMTGAHTAAFLVFALGCAVLFGGDKIVRPMAARGGTRLGFVWVLMGCIGGFEVLGLVGVVVGPVVLTLARELWAQRLRDLTRVDQTQPAAVISHAA
jgi:predicted PurR-regulated permease PerM